MIKIKNYLLKDNYLILILLTVHFLINIVIYFNTNSFYEISEANTNFDAYYTLIKGGRFLPMNGYFFLTPAYIAFFINELTGNGIFYYFIFQIFLSTITVFIVYKIILHITNSRNHAIIGIIILLFYLEYTLLGSVFYNQMYEIFFVSVFMLLAVKFNDEGNLTKLIIYTLLILIVIFTSMFFRKTLFYAFSLFIFLILLNLKNKKHLIKFVVLASISFVILYNYNPYKTFNSHYYNESETLFWGHTLYGGLGGEFGFVFPENEKRFNERLKQFTEINNIDTITRDVEIQFKKSEIKNFIKNEPHKWLLLQARKLFYTFGSVPQKDGLLMLYQGKIQMPWILSAIIIQFSYAIILIMFLLSVDINYKNIIQNSHKRIIYFMGLYLIGGVCIFSAYQERYRLVVFVCFFIPVIAMNFNKLAHILRKENRRELITKLIIILILLAVWIYQAYEALYIYHDRYFKVVQ